MGVGRSCPPVRNDIVTPRYLFAVLFYKKLGAVRVSTCQSVLTLLPAFSEETFASRVETHGKFRLITKTMNNSSF